MNPLPLLERRLSEAQWRFLRKVGPDGLLPFQKADMRSHGALLDMGLIAICYGYDSQGSGYVLTPAGRRALQAGP